MYMWIFNFILFYLKVEQRIKLAKCNIKANIKKNYAFLLILKTAYILINF